MHGSRPCESLARPGQRSMSTIHFGRSVYTLLLRLIGPAIVIGSVLVIATVQLDRGIGPLYLLGVLLVLLGVAGQLLRTRRQRPRQGHPPLTEIGRASCRGGVWSAVVEGSGQ